MGCAKANKFPLNGVAASEHQNILPRSRSSQPRFGSLCTLVPILTERKTLSASPPKSAPFQRRIRAGSTLGRAGKADDQ